LAEKDLAVPVAMSDVTPIVPLLWRTALLFDEARILNGELPVDVKAFSQRLTRVMKSYVSSR
jgi:hypothetical protein